MMVDFDQTLSVARDARVPERREISNARGRVFNLKGVRSSVPVYS